MKARDLKGMAVVSLDPAAKLGYVDELFFDMTQLRLIALDTSENGERAVIPFTEVHAIGRDAVTVCGSRTTRGANLADPLTSYPHLEALSKLKVVDEAGTFLGTVTDLEFDPQDGRITQVSTHQGGVLGIGGTSLEIPAETILSLGDEVMTVTDANKPRQRVADPLIKPKSAGQPRAVLRPSRKGAISDDCASSDDAFMLTPRVKGEKAG